MILIEQAKTSIDAKENKKAIELLTNAKNLVSQKALIEWIDQALQDIEQNH